MIRNYVRKPMPVKAQLFIKGCETGVTNYDGRDIPYIFMVRNILKNL